jgi:hypothetical protein
VIKRELPNIRLLLSMFSFLRGILHIYLIFLEIVNFKKACFQICANIQKYIKRSNICKGTKIVIYTLQTALKCTKINRNSSEYANVALTALVTLETW